MRSSGGGEKKENKVEFPDRVVIQILVPHYKGLRQLRFKNGAGGGEEPLDRGRFLEPAPELNRLEISEGTVTLNLVLN